MDTKSLRQEFMLLSGRFHSMNLGNPGNILVDISRSEFLTMEMIYRYMQNNQKSKGIGVSELAKCQKTSSPAISRNLRTMEEKGWIERSVDPKDRRNTYVYLTGAGKAKRMETADTLNRFTERVMERMGYDNAKQLLELAGKLEEVMRQELNCLQQSINKNIENTEGSNHNTW